MVFWINKKLLDGITVGNCNATEKRWSEREGLGITARVLA